MNLRASDVSSLVWRGLPGLAGIGLSFSACSASGPDEPSPEPAEVLVLTSNFQTGGEAGLAVTATDASAPGGTVVASAGPSVLHSDAVVRAAFDRAYVVNRLGGDNIQVLDPTTGFTTLHQLSVGAGSNPQDIAVVAPERAYVALYNAASLLIVNPESGETLGTVDLSAFAEGDPDGLPELSSVLQVGDFLIVAAQRLERSSSGFSPLGDSRLIRVSLSTDLPVDSMVLQAANPFGLLKLEADGAHVAIPCPGLVGSLDGGVERIQAATFVTEGLVVTEEMLGGDVLSVLGLPGIAGGDGQTLQWLTIVSQSEADGSANTRLVLLKQTPAPSLSVTPILEPDGFVLWDMLQSSSGRIWVTDRTLTAPGVWVYPDEALQNPTFVAFGADLLPPTWGVALN